MKEETSSTLPVSQEELLEKANEWDEKAKTHPELEEYGINQEFITGFEGEITDAAGYKTAKEVDKETAVLTAKKESKKKECYKWIKTSLVHYEKVYPNKNSAERKLFPEDYSKARTDDTHTVFIMPTIINLLTNNKDKLIAKGMKAEFIDKGAALLAELNSAKLDQKNKLEEDELYTIQRRIALNKVYNSINDISKAGQLAHEDDKEIGNYFDSPWQYASKKTAEANSTTATGTTTPAK